MRFFARALVVASVAVVPARADDAPLELDLDWQAPRECPSGADIHAELARIAKVRAGRVPPRVTARGTIERDGARYRLRLRTVQTGQAGERELVSGDCRVLAREVTLLLALAYGEGVEIVTATSDATQTATATPTPTPMPTPTPTSTPIAISTPTPPSSFHASYLAGAGILAGALPRPAPFLVAGADLGTERWWIAPRVLALPRTHDTLGGHLVAHYDGLGLSLTGCGGAGIGSWLVAACFGAGATALRASSVGATESGEAVAPWYTATGGVSLGWPAGATLALRLEGQLHVSLNEPRFVVEGFGEAHRVPRFGPDLALFLVLAPARAQSQATAVVASTKSSK